MVGRKLCSGTRDALAFQFVGATSRVAITNTVFLRQAVHRLECSWVDTAVKGAVFKHISGAVL